MRDYRVLIVADDATDRRLYCDLLAQLEPGTCHVREAADAEAGLAALAVESFDCVLLDYNLPTMNGFEFLTAAAVAGDVPCAVVLITEQGDELVAIEAIKRGVQDCLVKDRVHMDNLRRAVTHAVAQAELQERLARSMCDLGKATFALEQEAATRKSAEAELHAARQAMEQANLAKISLVCMVTDELRTPLNGILGYAQLLRLEGGLSPRQDAQVGEMMQAGRHMLEMIDGVLDFISIDTGSIAPLREQVLVGDLVEACIGFISPMATERAIGLRVVSAHDAPRKVVTDPTRLRQVLLNLLGYATKNTSVGSVELRLVGGATPGSLRIEVADTGPGIDDICRHRLSQGFEGLGAAALGEGADLGLAIAAWIVKQMGGRINYMANAAAGELGTASGSVFWFELPAAEAVPAVRTKTASVASTRRLLLVDDIKINLDIIGSFLDTAGHQVVMAESGAEAVRLAGEQMFDLILMDMRMPEMDGMEAARRIRMLPGAQGRVTILALTAYPSIDQVAHCLDAGMDGHVPKPVDYDTLMRAIDDAIVRVAPVRKAGLAQPMATAPWQAAEKG